MSRDDAACDGPICAIDGEALVLTADVWSRLLAKRQALGRCLSRAETMAVAQEGWPEFVDAVPGELEGTT